MDENTTPEEIISEELPTELVTYEVNPDECSHTSGINYCSGFRGDGSQCSHCSECGTQL
jgi:hypothetical protein